MWSNFRGHIQSLTSPVSISHSSLPRINYCYTLCRDILCICKQVYLQSFSPSFFATRYMVCYIHYSAPSFSNLEVSHVKYIKGIITVLLWFSFPQQVFFFFLVCKTITHLTVSAVVDLMKCMAPHSSPLAWKIPWTEEAGRLQSVGSLSRTRLSDLTFTFMHWRRKWQPTPVFLPRESQGRRDLVGCRLWGRTESDTTEAT